MAFKIDLSQDIPRPLKVVVESTGDEVRFTFKRRLNRQQRFTMTKSVGKGKKSREIPDMERMWRTCIESIDGIDLEGKGSGPITDPDTIVAVMNSPQMDEDVVEAANEYIMGLNTLSEQEGNS